jgi:ribosomal protein S16
MEIGDDIDITVNSDEDDIELRSEEDENGKNAEFDPTSDDYKIKKVEVKKAATPTPVTDLTVTKVGDYNSTSGYIDITVNDSSLATGAKVNGTAVTSGNFQVLDGTTIRIFASAEPSSISITTAKGDIVAKAATSLTVTKVGTYNPILGYIDVTVNDSSLATGAKVNGTAVTSDNFKTPNGTTVRIFTDEEPTSISITTAKGDVVAKAATPATTLTVTNVGTYNPILGYINITVNDSSLATGAKVNGTAVPSTDLKTPNGTTVRIFVDEEPTSIILTTAKGDVTAKASTAAATLSSTIVKAEALTEGNYTTETWQVVQTKLGAAKTVAENTSATEEQITTAQTELEAAITALK